jgi:hypothetical protein
VYQDATWVGLSLCLSLLVSAAWGPIVIPLLLFALVVCFALFTQERKHLLITTVDSFYEHYLFYDDFDPAENALKYIKETFDESAELCPFSDDDETCMVVFDTNKELSKQQVQELVKLLSPDGFNLNNDPWSEDE